MGRRINRKGRKGRKGRGGSSRALTNGPIRAKETYMDESTSAEDRQIEWIFIGLGTALAGALMTAVLVAGILIALNFNILEWME